MEPEKKESDWWSRHAWWISSSCRLVFGSQMLTVGLYHGELSKKRNGAMDYLVYFNKVPKHLSDTTPTSRLPGGTAVSLDQWDDFKMSFAYLYMFMESKSIPEVSLMFGFKDTDWIKEGRRFEDGKNDQLMTPLRNMFALRHSKEKAKYLEKALTDWKPINPPPAPRKTAETDMNALLEEEDDEDADDAASKDGDDDGSTGTRHGSDFDDSDDDVQVTTEATAPKASTAAKKQSAQKKELNKQLEREDLLCAETIPAKKAKTDAKPKKK